MEIQFYGANCVRLTNKKVSVIIDDNLTSLGLKSVTRPDDIAISTDHDTLESSAKFLINSPGEYEISEVSIKGIPAEQQTERGVIKSTVYSIEMQNYTVGVIGHINPDLNDEQLEALGAADVLTIPVGGNGYTVDAVGAVRLIKKIEPRIVVPTHYADSAIKYQVPQVELQVFLKEMGLDSSTKPLDSLKVKDAETNGKTTGIVLKRLATNSR